MVLRRLVAVAGLGPSRDAKDVELAVLRHQLAVLHRQVARPMYRPADRMVLAWLASLLPRERWSVFLVTPGTLLRWHRELVAHRWTYRAGAWGHQLRRERRRGLVPDEPERPRASGGGPLDLPHDVEDLVDDAAASTRVAAGNRSDDPATKSSNRVRTARASPSGTAIAPPGGPAGRDRVGPVMTARAPLTWTSSWASRSSTRKATRSTSPSSRPSRTATSPSAGCGCRATSSTKQPPHQPLPSCGTTRTCRCPYLRGGTVRPAIRRHCRHRGVLRHRRQSHGRRRLVRRPPRGRRHLTRSERGGHAALKDAFARSRGMC
jgi:hypothetical protein